MWITLALSAGISSTLYVLWRARGSERDKLIAQNQAENARQSMASMREEIEAQKKLYAKKLAKKDAEIEVLRAQRQDAIDALENSTSPGSLRNALRLSLGIK